MLTRRGRNPPAALSRSLISCRDPNGVRSYGQWSCPPTKSVEGSSPVAEPAGGKRQTLHCRNVSRGAVRIGRTSEQMSDLLNLGGGNPTSLRCIVRSKNTLTTRRGSTFPVPGFGIAGRDRKVCVRGTAHRLTDLALDSGNRTVCVPTGVSWSGSAIPITSP